MITTILHARDEEVGLAKTLAALVPAATDGLIREVILVDGGSRDGTLDVADAAGCDVVTGAGGEGLRRAADAARGEWLLFLPPATVLEPNWQAEALAFIDGAAMAGDALRRAAYFRLARVEPGWRARRAEWLASIRSWLFAAPLEEQGLLISRAFYRSLGGHRDLAAMADVDLARRIGRSRFAALQARAFVRNGDRRAGVRRPVRTAACLALFVLRLPPVVIGRIAG